jgi:farnesyl diphosphate synthase
VTTINYESYIARINNYLKQVVPSDTINLHEAMQYSTSSGKRLRPLIVYIMGKHFKVNEELLDVIAASIEIVHCYSLIHDDLPCMDDDDLRRGKPTTHIKFSEAIALLAGDALQGLAFKLLSDSSCLNDSVVSNQNKLAMIMLLADAIGANGMVLGQQLDLNAENDAAITLEDLKHIHNLKTGQLFKAAFMLPYYCQLISPSMSVLALLEKISYHFGIAFQIQDDLLDDSDPAIIGKSSGSDQRNNKATYLSLLGKKGAEDELSKELNVVYELARDFPDFTNFVASIISVRKN